MEGGRQVPNGASLNKSPVWELARPEYVARRENVIALQWAVMVAPRRRTGSISTCSSGWSGV